MIFYFVPFMFLLEWMVFAQEQIEINFPTDDLSQEKSTVPITTVEVPPGLKYYTCGFSYPLPRFRLHSPSESVSHHPYYLNVTADKLRCKGFSINITEMDSDQIKAMTYTNGTFTGNSSFSFITSKLPVGGKTALKVRAHAMALIGHRKGNETNWFCDGVLINRNWVLSAAHCLLNPSLAANVIRLGEYDRATEEDHGTPEIPYYDQTLDYEIENIVPHPEFLLKERYHDLILFKLNRSIPKYSLRIQPICLPWGKPQNNKIDQNLVGSNVTLTGWGATSFGRVQDKTDILQEVDLEVFDTEVCDLAYSRLQSFRARYPRGMSGDEILCVGSLEGGKDACKGDSGGPLVYENPGSYSPLILVGIVSGGLGCGLKEYPGLYIPIYKPKYIQWIKEIAFEEYL